MASQVETKQPDPYNTDAKHLVKIFQDKIKARGARGIVGLQRIFKIMDDDHSRSLSEQEFAKACRDFKTGISDENVPILFNMFDTNRDGTLSIDEFIYAIRGDMNDARVKMVEKAFQCVDKDGSGILDIEDIKGTYNASKHPDVLAGKKTEDNVLVEFLQTFEAHHNLKEGGENDGRVTVEEFIEYYKNISCSIDDDSYFSLMMNNSWNIKGDATPYKKFEKGWANEDAKPKEQPTFRHP